jgi:hypothetical protein
MKEWEATVDQAVLHESKFYFENLFAEVYLAKRLKWLVVNPHMCPS